jgi:hypothetical protein
MITDAEALATAAQLVKDEMREHPYLKAVYDRLFSLWEREVYGDQIGGRS